MAKHEIGGSIGRPHASRALDVLIAAAAAILAVKAFAAAAATCASLFAAIGFPLQLDYGEGIVWYQWTRIPGPDMYSRIAAAPYVVFHYPPVYYLVVHLMAWFGLDPLAAGRAASSLATVLVLPSLFVLVMLSTGGLRPGADRRRVVGIALVCCALALGFHAVRSWAPLMRVDMVGLAFAFAGLAVGAWADGRFAGTLVALLLCTLAVFSKQTLVAAGMAVFIVGVWRRPVPGLAAGAVTLAMGVGAVAWLQHATAGGFLDNVVSGNVNRFNLRNAARVLVEEATSLPFILVMVGAAAWLAWRLVPPGPRGWVAALGRTLRALRQPGRERAARALLLLHFGLAGLTLGTLFKSGGTFNYMIEFLLSGCAIVAILLADLARDPAHRRALAGVLAVLATGALLLPFSVRPAASAEQIADHDRLVERIRGSGKPVWSEDMTLLMRAGKPVYAEPAIVTELGLTGQWDEAPLVRFVADRGFAFLLTANDRAGESDRRSAALDAAMRAAYPHRTLVRRGIWLWDAE